MKLKKVLSGFLSAAIVATSTAIVMPLSASAAEFVIREIGTGDVPADEIPSVAKARINFSITALNDAGYGTLTAYTNGSTGWQQRTYATTTQYNLGAGTAWQADEEVTELGEKSVTLNFAPDNWGYGIGIKTTDPNAIKGKITSVDFLDASDSVIKTFDATAPTVGAYSFTFSDLKLEEMKKGEFFTIAFESDNTPETLKYNFKYKVPKIENPSTEADYDYFAPVDNCIITEQGQSETGLKVTSSTDDTRTIYKFEAVSASRYPFSVGIEYSIKGDWSDTAWPWYGNDVSFYVPHVAVTDITLDKTAITLAKGDTDTIIPTITPDDATYTSIVYDSSNTDVATVDEDGLVTAVANGTAKIIVTAGEKSATCDVTVQTPATGVEIQKPSNTNLIVGDNTLKLTAKAVPEDASDATDITWNSSKPEVAAIATDGTVTAKAVGETEITAKMGSFTSEPVIIKVSDKVVPATGLTITSTNLTDGKLTLEVGDTESLNTKIAPEDSTDAITWSSSNEKVASVDANGKVTAIAEGSATITAKANDTVSASCEVTVNAKAPDFETKPYTLNVVNAVEWEKPGVKMAAQVNVPVTTLNGFKPGTTTYKDIKNKTLKLKNLGFGSCELEGIKAENVEVSIYLQLGANWEHWCATADYTLADGEVELDLSTLAAQGVKDTDVLQAIGFQFNIMGTVGGINDMAVGDKVVINVAEPKLIAEGEEPPAEEPDYDTGKVETVDDYVPAEAGTELVVRSITATQAAIYDSYTITVKDNNGKTYTTTTSDCYKAFKYNTASGEKTEEANGYFIIVKVTNVPAGTTVTVTIEPTK